MSQTAAIGTSAPSTIHSQPDCLGRLRVDEDAQAWFAHVSGDRNPIHLSHTSAVAAGFDCRVVHGVHVLLRLLETSLAQAEPRSIPSVMSVRFAKPLFVGEEARVWAQECGGASELWLQIGKLRLLELTLNSRVSPDNLAPVPAFWSDVQAPELPRETDLGATPSGSFSIAAPRSLAELGDAFPLLRGALGEGRIASIAQQSPLVGMHYPGQRSLFLTLDLNLTDVADGPPQYVVKRADSRLGVIEIEGRGAGIATKARALVRGRAPDPVPLTGLRRLPLEGRYRTQRAVVIGGSRGLGRIVASMIALGGGAVCLTYARSREPAETLAADLRAFGGAAEAFQMSVGTGGSVTHDVPVRYCDVNAIYYFATPRIFNRGTGTFDGARFHSFADCYVNGMCGALEVLRKRLSKQRKALYFPSTVALERPVAGLAEYAVAKAAAEAMAPTLELGERHLSVLFGRLPRIATEQTVSPVPVAAVDGIDLMMSEVDRVQASIDRDGQ